MNSFYLHRVLRALATLTAHGQPTTARAIARCLDVRVDAQLLAALVALQRGGYVRLAPGALGVVWCEQEGY